MLTGWKIFEASTRATNPAPDPLAIDYLLSGQRDRRARCVRQILKGATENAATVQALIDNLVERACRRQLGPHLDICDGWRSCRHDIGLQVDFSP
jgi:hypothetical protein